MTWWKLFSRHYRRQRQAEIDLHFAEWRLAIGRDMAALISDPKQRGELLEALEEKGREIYKTRQAD